MAGEPVEVQVRVVELLEDFKANATILGEAARN